VYLLNGRPSACHYHDDSDLLQELTLDELREHIARKKRWLACCERKHALRGRSGQLLDMIWPLRREIRELRRTLKRYTGWMEREGLKVRIKAKPADEPRRAA
jgi:hypothetical protein